MVHLRSQMKAQSPAAWAAVPTNGRFNLLVPHLLNMRSHDEAFYASCVHEIFRHGKPRNPFWPEEQGLGSWIQNSVSMYALAGLALLCGGNMTAAWCLATALLGAGWFCLYYRVFYWWSSKWEVALPLSLFSVLFPDLYVWLLDINFHPRVNIERYAGVFFQYHTLVRPDFYRLPSSFFTLFLLCWLFVGAWSLTCQTKRRPVASIFLGLGFGLMAWVHPFEFLFGMSTLMVLTASTWLWETSAERKFNLTSGFIVSLPIGAACMAFISRTVSPAAWKDHLEFLGVSHSRRPYFITLIHLIFAAGGAYLMKRESDPKRRAAWLVLLCAQIGIFLCRNDQVVLGFSIQPFHFIPLGSLLGCLMLFIVLARRLAAWPRWNARAGALLTAFVLVWALTNEKMSAERTFRMFGLPSATEAALDWTRDSVPPDSQILTLSMPTMESIPLYTNARVLGSPLSLMTTPFTQEAYLRKIAVLLKTSRADADRFLDQRWVLPEVRSALQAEVGREQRELSFVDLPKLEAAEWFYSVHRDLLTDASVLRKRQELKALVDAAEPLKTPYYLWVNADDAQLLRQNPESYGGKRVYENASVTIYQFPGETVINHG